MLKTTQKDIKEFPAIDITYYSEEQLKALPQGPLNPIACSVGVYGVNSVLFYDGENSRFYKITERSTNFFRLF